MVEGANNMDGFKQLLQTIRDCTKRSDKIKVGLEATGHYSYNILGFLLDNDLAVYVMNPLHTNLYRKSLSLRKTKTDRVDAKMCIRDSPYTMTKIMMLKIRMVMPMKKDCKNSPNRGPTSICIRLDCSMDKPMSLTRVFPAMMPLESDTTFWVMSVSYTHLDVYKRQQA